MEQTGGPQAGEMQKGEKKESNIIGGVVLIVLGLLFLANNLIPEFHIGEFWPLILVAIGAGILWKHRRGA